MKNYAGQYCGRGFAQKSQGGSNWGVGNINLNLG